MRKSVTLEGFTIDLERVNPEQKVLDYVKKNDYIIPKIVEQEAGLAPSTASSLLKRLAEQGLLKDLGSTSVQYKGKMKHRCHLYTKP